MHVTAVFTVLCNNRINVNKTKSAIKLRFQQNIFRVYHKQDFISYFEKVLVFIITTPLKKGMIQLRTVQCCLVALLLVMNLARNTEIIIEAIPRRY